MNKLNLAAALFTTIIALKLPEALAGSIVLILLSGAAAINLYVGLE